MDSLPHHCTYDEYGCGHKEPNCHASAGEPDRQQRTRRMWTPGLCPHCLFQTDVNAYGRAAG